MLVAKQSYTLSYADRQVDHHVSHSVGSQLQWPQNPTFIIQQNPTLWRRLQPDTLTSLTNSQLDRPANDTSLGCPFRLAFSNEVSTVRAESIAAFVADKALIMPLPPNCAYHDIVQHRLLASETPRSCATRVAVQAPCKPILFYKRCFCIEWLDKKIH